MKNLCIAVLALIALMSCGSNDQVAPSNDQAEPFVYSADSVENQLSDTDFNILFVGNSLTHSNDLPGLVRKYAREKKNLTIGTKMVAEGGYAIIDHWNDGRIQKDIASTKFDFVVIQQGPSSQDFGRQVLIQYGAKIKELCNENDAKLAYFMVWPSLHYYETFDGVIKNHKDAAAMNNSILCPVGKVWKEYFDSTDDFSYYGGDGFHPSRKGSEVAANVIMNSLF